MADLLPIGRHRARAAEWALGRSGTGKEQVAILFSLLDRPGEEITSYLFFTDACLDITIKSLRACGWRGADLSDLTGMDSNEVTLVIDHEEDQKGVMRARVRWINTTGGLAMKATLDKDQSRAFAAQMKGRILQHDRMAGQAAAKAAPPSADEQDDIPF